MGSRFQVLASKRRHEGVLCVPGSSPCLWPLCLSLPPPCRTGCLQRPATGRGNKTHLGSHPGCPRSRASTCFCKPRFPACEPEDASHSIRGSPGTGQVGSQSPSTAHFCHAASLSLGGPPSASSYLEPTHRGVSIPEGPCVCCQRRSS